MSGARQPICSRAFTYQYPYSLVVHIEDYELHSTSTKSLHCMCSISANSRTLNRDTGRAHTSCTHFNWIFELMSSLRSNYVLYRDTMPLTKHLTFENTNSIGFKSGLYGGRKQMSAPVLLIISVNLLMW